jgi:hypothetical protein
MALTTNATLTPGGGVVPIVVGPVTNYFVIHSYPHKMSVVYVVATSLPAANTPGLHVDCGEFWANGALPAGTSIYARISNNANDVVQVSAYQN